MERRGNGNVSWERFEEQTKLAFVGDPLNSRFFLKTRVTAQKSVKVVARVAHQAAKPTPASPRATGGGVGGRGEAVKYGTTDPAHLVRLTRLLRFVMQEVLGPMKPLPAAGIGADTSATATATATPVSPKGETSSASGADKKNKKNKKKNKKKAKN
ncbi:hypothetical protein BBJ28_00019394 [Nothophytophthora sp. Chile5]|nr:hypothetical protein BBJ28_00019394 [Nothophytophthora sp. Chile5]